MSPAGSLSKPAKRLGPELRAKVEGTMTLKVDTIPISAPLEANPSSNCFSHSENFLANLTACSHLPYCPPNTGYLARILNEVWDSLQSSLDPAGHMVWGE
jgi:hypothetical protein